MLSTKLKALKDPFPRIAGQQRRLPQYQGPQVTLKNVAKTRPPAKLFQIRPKPAGSTNGPGTKTQSGWLTTGSTNKEEHSKRKFWACANTAGGQPSQAKPAALPVPRNISSPAGVVMLGGGPWNNK